MDECKEIFKRELGRLNYLYAKANTKSKKVRLAFDLIFFVYKEITISIMNYFWLKIYFYIDIHMFAVHNYFTVIERL